LSASTKEFFNKIGQKRKSAVAENAAGLSGNSVFQGVMVFLVVEVANRLLNQTIVAKGHGVV